MKLLDKGCAYQRCKNSTNCRSVGTEYISIRVGGECLGLKVNPRRPYIFNNWVLQTKVVYIKDIKIVPPAALLGAEHIRARAGGMSWP